MPHLKLPASRKLFTGGHMGKMLCKVASEEEKQA